MAAESPTHPVDIDALLAQADWVHAVARALVRDPAEARDLAQDTMEVALKAGPSQDRPLRPWLGGVVRNLWRSRARASARRVARETAAVGEADADAAVPTPAQLVERVETQQLLARRVLELDEPFRSTLLLRYYEGLSAAEIARRLELPAGTVRWRLKRGLELLRAALDAQFEGDRKRWAVLVAPLVWKTPAGKTGAGIAAGVKGVVIVKTSTKLIALAVLLIAAVWGTRQAGLWGKQQGGSGEAPVVARPGSEANQKQAVAPAGMRVGDTHSVRGIDPVGTIRLEGQVIDESEAPVPRAIVAIDTNPPRIITAEEDGSFAIDRLIARTYRLEAHAGDRYAGPVQLALTADAEPVVLRARPAGVVSVHVQDEATRSPIAGAAIELRSTLTWTAETDAAGDAELRGVAAAMMPLRVVAKGYAPAAAMLWTSDDPSIPRHQVMSLRRGAAVRGVVVDAAGKPIAGARVLAVAASEPFPVEDPQRDGVVTDAQGRWSLEAIAAGTYRFVAHGDGLAPATTAPMLVDGVHERTGIEIRVPGAAVIAGKVITADGAPVPAAMVRVVARGDVFWRYAAQVYSAEDGSYRVEGLPRLEVDVVASQGTASSELVPVDLTEQTSVDLALTLSITGAIAGTVVDEKGAPLAEAMVAVEPVFTGVLHEHATWGVRGDQYAISDPSGGFRFGGLPAGDYRVRAARPGGSEAALWSSAGVVAATGRTDLRVIVPADGRIEGRVLFEDGSAPQAFTIAVGPAPPAPFASKDGAFVLDGPGGTHDVVVRGGSFAREIVVDAVLESGAVTDLGTITVKKGRSLSGRVLDPDGNPVAEARVAAGSLISGSGTELNIPEEGFNVQETTTDEDGRFIMRNFGEHSLYVVAQGDGIGRSSSVRVPGGKDSAYLDLILKSTGRLEGVVTMDGKPVPEAVVIATPIGATASNFFVVTGQDGSYALDMLTEGQYAVYPMIGGGGPRPKDMFAREANITAGKTTRADVAITTGPISLEVVVTANRKPVVMAQVLLLQADVSASSMEVIRDGTMLIGRASEAPLGFYMRIAMGEAARVDKLVPDTYTACAVPFPVQDMAGAMKMRERAEQLPMKCNKVVVQAQPPTQQVTIEVPVEWTVPAGESNE
ncbi:MAG TPA: sigma-70 family RNA polymerase sigma factor [Kofleriaceae bacterium]|nr:sigma-70 family RNA polymerase sigma factor [Kofleriaceae bacterium]